MPMGKGASKGKELKGIPVVPGTACGEFIALKESKLEPIPSRNIERSQAEAEEGRFQRALDLAREEIELLQEGEGAQREILNAQLLMLTDPEFVPLVKGAIKSKLLSAEAALKGCIDASVAALSSSGNDFLAGRAADIKDAFGRVMQKLIPTGEGQRLHDVSLKGKILAARDIAPSKAISLKREGIAAIAMEEGGPACHVAVLAKSWGIPAVLGVSGLMDALSALPEGSRILVDGAEGKVIVNPSIKDAKAREKPMPAAKERAGAKGRRLKCETADGVGFSILANIAAPEECETAFLMEGISGVGLFRTEFLFLQGDKHLISDEETQFKAYRDAAMACGHRVLTIRTMDLGADKAILSQEALHEKNPLLGWRALRYSLSERSSFKAQLRAILRASAFGRARVMFPMVASVSELEEALSILEEAKDECRAAGIPFDEGIKAGAMIEVPSAAVCADLIARRASFISIGTNDLIQYTMAADRENPKVACLHNPFEPAVLRLIRHVLQCGERAACEVSLCGEMAGDPLSACLLFGLGLRRFSMSAGSAPAVSAALSSFTAPFLAECAEKALQCETGKDALSDFKAALGNL